MLYISKIGQNIKDQKEKEKNKKWFKRLLFLTTFDSIEEE